jgi:calcineurin-like phosphoesterase family protein
MNFYITSDFHVCHGNILKYCRRNMFLNPAEIAILDEREQALALPEHERPKTLPDFRPRQESVQAMNAHILGEINKLVKPNDALLILGDFCFGRGSDYERNVRDFRKAIRCETVRLVLGNHDNGTELIRSGAVSCFSNGRKGWLPNILLDERINHKRYTYCHYAMHSWPGSGNPHHPAYHFYGHSHGTLEDKLDTLFPSRHSMDAGIDNAFRLFGDYRPFLLDEAVEIINRKAKGVLRLAEPEV